jgi:AcrR family transcriptional regulator
VHAHDCEPAREWRAQQRAKNGQQRPTCRLSKGPRKAQVVFVETLTRRAVADIASRSRRLARLEYFVSFHDTASQALKVDGRRQRSQRTRLAIILAYLELLRQSSVMPTAAQIAKEAGCSVRSIFERFSDLDALSLATADYAIAQGQAEAVARNVDGDRPTRIQSHVETRALACEKWLPLWRIITDQDQIAELKTRVVLVRLANIERMKLMYAPELSSLLAPERTQLLIALAALTSFESWDQMRQCHGLSMDTAQHVWRFAIDRMLPLAG